MSRPQDGQLGEVDVDTAPRSGHSHQLTIICPLDAIKAAFVIQGHDGMHLLQVRQVVDLDAAADIYAKNPDGK